MMSACALWTFVSAPGFCASVAGVVHDAQQHVVEGVGISAVAQGGRMLGQSTTNSHGEYVINQLPSGPVTLRLDPLNTGFKGADFLTSVDKAGLGVDWTVSSADKATAQVKPLAGGFLAEDPFGMDMATFLAATALATSVIAGGVIGGYAAAGGFSSSSPPPPPTIVTPSN